MEGRAVRSGRRSDQFRDALTSEELHVLLHVRGRRRDFTAPYSFPVHATRVNFVVDCASHAEQRKFSRAGTLPIARGIVFAHTFLCISRIGMGVIDRRGRARAFFLEVRALTIHHANTPTKRRGKSLGKITSPSLRVATLAAGAYTLRTPQGTNCTARRAQRNPGAKHGPNRSGCCVPLRRISEGSPESCAIDPGSFPDKENERFRNPRRLLA